MVKYYYFPKSFENQLAEAITEWIKKTDSFIVTTGVYKLSENVDLTDTLVFNKSISGEITYIKNGYISENNEFFELIGFCFEADIENLAPEYQQLIDTLPQILQFLTSIDFLECYKTV